MGRGPKRQYTLEFKEQAVDLALRVGATKASEQLGVAMANLQRWKHEVKAPEAKATAKAEKQTKAFLEEENRRLQRENEELKKVNHILKRAAAFFSQDHLK